MDEDNYSIPNVWIFSLTTTHGDELHTKIENTNPADPNSTPNRGRRVVDFRVV